MATAAPLLNAFNAGEVGKLFEARTDHQKRNNAVEILENFIPLVQGPVVNRPGTHHVKYVCGDLWAFGANTVRAALIPFEFSTEQAYVIELSSTAVSNYAKFKFYKDNGAILETPVSITDITRASPGIVTTSAAHGYADGDEVYISGVAGMTEVNNRFFEVDVLTTTTFALKDPRDNSGLNTIPYTAYTSGGTCARVYTVASPWDGPDLYDADGRLDVRYVQSADTMFMVQRKYTPYKLTRSAHTSWAFTALDLQDGPYLPANVTTTTLITSGITGSVTVTASATTGINDDNGFYLEDVGRLIRLKDAAGNWTWLQITGYTSTTVVTATVRGPDLSAPVATTDWRLGLYHDSPSAADNEYPSMVMFFEDRLFLAGTKRYPQRIDASRSGDYENFTPTDPDGTVVGDHALAFTLSADKVNAIRWLSNDERGLAIGTVGGEWIMRPSISGEALTPFNISAKRSSAYGSANVNPVRAGKAAALFVQRAGRRVRELAYVYEDDGFRAPDMTLLAPHVTLGGVMQMDYHQEPWLTAWAPRYDGTLLGMLYDREQDAVGWHRHVLAGESSGPWWNFGSGGGEQTAVESVAVIPSPDGQRDQVWMAVRRYIEGKDSLHIEYMDKGWEEGDTQGSAFYVDSGLQYNGSPVTTLTGLWHLEGETVTILADGAAHSDKTVASGSITLDVTASEVSVGLGYVPVLKTLRIEGGARDGTAQGRKKRINQVVFRFVDTLGTWVGRDAANMDPVVFREVSDPMDSAPPLYSGDVKMQWRGGYDRDGYIRVEQRQPFPVTLTAIMPLVETETR